MGAPVVITIDGRGATGKSTLAKNLASRMGGVVIHTGVLYRYIAMCVLEAGGAVTQESVLACALLELKQSVQKVESLVLGQLSLSKMETEAVAEVASQIAVFPLVRTLLTRYQRELITRYCQKKKPVILEGRDAGSVVCPEAGVKFFLEAPLAVRVKRRDVTMEQQLRRDSRDEKRTIAPLVCPKDAYILDTTGNKESMTKAAMAYIASVFPHETLW